MSSTPEARLELGRREARAAAERGDVLVVVDVLSFSPEDVEEAACVDVVDCAPVLAEGCFACDGWAIGR